MQHRWIAPLLFLLLWPPGAADAAQAWSGLELQRRRCAETGAAALCRLALEQSHGLKNWAEQRKLWRCYTALLGAEAVMLSAALSPGAAPGLEAAEREVNQACGR